MLFSESEPTPVIWNTNKRNGWEKYHEATDVNEKLDNVVETSDGDVNKMMKKIDNILTDVKLYAFGKVKYKKKSKEQNLQRKKLEHIKRKDDVSAPVIEDIDNELKAAIHDLNNKKFKRSLQQKKIKYCRN